MAPAEDLEERLRLAAAESLHAELATEPLAEDPLALIFAPVIAGTGGAGDRDAAAAALLSLLEHATPERAAEVFGRIVRMKEQAGLPEHRHAKAFRAYIAFTSAAGREPTKIELKDFILSRPETYGTDWPGREDPWSRIWEGAGLKGLPAR